MTARRPSKPWKVILTGPDADVTTTSQFTGETKAYAFALGALGSGSSATLARIEHWEGGCWALWELLRADDVPA